MAWTRRSALAMTVAACAAASALAPAPLHAQLAVTANAGTVRYESAPSEQSAGLSPELRLQGSHAAFALNAALTSGSDGSRIAAGGPSLWLATSPILHHVQLDAQGSFQYTSPRGDSSSYAAMGVGEIAFTSDGPGFALGAGGGTGKIAGSSAINALKARARGWFDAGPVSFTLMAEPTLISGTWYADFALGGSASVGPVEGELDLQVRQSHTSGTSAGAELDAAWHFARTMALQVSGGRYLRDPFQGLPAGNFVTVGIKAVLWSPRPREGSGVSESALSDVDFGSAGGLKVHGNGNSLLRIRNVPALSHGNSGTSGGGSGTTGRGHKP